MKQPVWILNSSLLVMIGITQLFLFMMQRTIPSRISIAPRVGATPFTPKKNQVDIVKVYEYDLFGTYEAPIAEVPNFVQETIPPMPQPPAPVAVSIPVEKAPIFFAPLDAILKGVIFVKDDPASCIGIIQIKKTKEERNYRVGDLIEDAQILKILSNRIIIIRSNGQQETLYLRDEDAVFDFNNQTQRSFQAIISQVGDYVYKINVDEFLKVMSNIGQFIQALDITTAYKQGKSFGCKVGKVEKNSLAQSLGFAIDDVIVKVDAYYLDDLDNRIQAYNHVVNKKIGDTVEVVVARGVNLLHFTYGLVDKNLQSIIFTPQQTHQKLVEELHKHAASIAHQQPEKVVIQSLKEDDLLEDQITSESKIISNINQQIVHKNRMDDTHLAPVVIQSFDVQPLSQVEQLMQQKNNLASSVNAMKMKDRANIIKHAASTNVISQGITN